MAGIVISEINPRSFLTPAIRTLGRFCGVVQALSELELRTKASVSAIVNVARDEEGVDLLFDAEVNDIFVGLEGGVPQGEPHLVGRGCPLPQHRAIEM